jgi:hypothetical protein
VARRLIGKDAAEFNDDLEPSDLLEAFVIGRRPFVIELSWKRCDVSPAKISSEILKIFAHLTPHYAPLNFD